MYSPGEVNKKLGIDPKTVYAWVDARFPEFFSDMARGIGVLNRQYTEEDLVVLNTILKLRAQKQDWEKIRAQLANGHRDAELPPSFYEMDGDKAVLVYSQIKTLETALETANGEIERLRKELENERDRAEELRARERKELQEQIVNLNRQIAVLQYQLEQKNSPDQ